MKEGFPITGGIAKNSTVVTRFEKELGVIVLKSSMTQDWGRLGAAFFAQASLAKKKI